MRFRKSAVFFAVLVFSAAGFLSAQQSGVVKEVKGKVELRSGGGGWTAAAPGSPVAQGTTVSTGFNSQTLIDFGASEILVRPLTRMTLRELVQQGGTVKTGLSLEVGKVRAEVKTASGVEHDFKVLSTVSTAAVRGTIIEGDPEVWGSTTGTFLVSNRAGRTVTVRTGQKAVVTGDDPPSGPRDQLEKGSSVTVQTNPSPGGSSGNIFSAGPAVTDYSSADVIIELEFEE